MEKEKNVTIERIVPPKISDEEIQREKIINEFRERLTKINLIMEQDYKSIDSDFYSIYYKKSTILNKKSIKIGRIFVPKKDVTDIKARPEFFDIMLGITNNVASINKDRKFRIKERIDMSNLTW